VAPPSPAADDYLKAVFHHTEWQDDPIMPSELANSLGVAPSSVTEMVKKLAKAGYVSHVPYGAIRLTHSGEQRALAVIRRHRIMETWLTQEHGYNWDEVHEEAEILEHAVSDRLLDSIDEKLGRPRFDPHGDAIPDAEGKIEREPFILLALAPKGHTGRVLRVHDRQPHLLRHFDEIGLAVGRLLYVIEAEVVSIEEGEPVTLMPGSSQVVWLSV